MKLFSFPLMVFLKTEILQICLLMSALAAIVVVGAYLGKAFINFL